MRLTVIAAGSLFAATFAGSVGAAEITKQGARDLQAGLTRFLPDGHANSGFISVRPDGARYAIVTDWSKLLQKFEPRLLTVNGLQPLTTFARPLDGGLWKVDGNDSLDISGEAKAPDGAATHFNYSIGSFVYSGIFDPAISYFRSGEATLKDLKGTSITGADKVVFRLDGMDQTFGAVDRGDGRTVDLTSDSTATSFYQKVTAADAAGSVEIRAESFVAKANAQGVLIKELRDLIAFGFEHAKDEKLTQESSDRLKTLLRAAMPMFSSAEEEVTVNNVSIGTAVGNLGLKKIGYSLQLDGLTEASRIAIGFKTEGLDLGAAPVPPAYAPFVPDRTELQVVVSDLNFKAFIDEILTFDFAQLDKIPPAEMEKAGMAIFPNGNVMVEFPKVAATSASYDVEVSGRMISNIQRTDRVSLEASVLARDYDKTIAAVQKAAKSDPQLNQVSLGLMMVKGFAKTEPDGRQRWDIRVADDGSVTVNGQLMKGPN